MQYLVRSYAKIYSLLIGNSNLIGHLVCLCANLAAPSESTQGNIGTYGNEC